MKVEMMSYRSALRFLIKYNKWRKGEIDEWSTKERTPPPKDMDRFMRTTEHLLRNALSQIEEWKVPTK